MEDQNIAMYLITAQHRNPGHVTVSLNAIGTPTLTFEMPKTVRVQHGVRDLPFG